MRNFYVIAQHDVGQSTIRAFQRTWIVADFIGAILLTDVGKRVYHDGDILQVENEEQLADRLIEYEHCLESEVPDGLRFDATPETRAANAVWVEHGGPSESPVLYRRGATFKRIRNVETGSVTYFRRKENRR